MSSNLWNEYDAKPNNSGQNGINFSSSSRNRTLIKNGIVQPKPFTNGNTVVGLIYSKGVILGADTRANLGNLLISQTSEKIHRLHSLIYTAGAGISRDLQQTARITASRLEMIASNSNTLYPRVRCANRMFKRHLFRYRGGIMANYLVAGVDRSGSELYCTDMDGYSKKVSYAALGSGGLAATSLLKSGWRPNLKEKDAYDLVCDAVVAGIQNDVCSATKVNMCILRKDFTHKQQQQTVQLHGKGDRATDSGDIQQTDLRNIDVVEESVYLPPPPSMDNFFFGPWTGSIFEQPETSSSTADDEQQETSSSTAEGEQQDDDNKDISSILEN